jgi:lactate permease
MRNRESRGRRPRLSCKEEKKRFRPSKSILGPAGSGCWTVIRRNPYARPTLPPMLYWPPLMSALWPLAAFPVLLVVLLMTVLHWPAARAGLVGLISAMIISAVWFGADLSVQGVALARGGLMALDVLPIVWGAYAFYRVTAEAGAIDALTEALPALTPSRGLQALVIGWAFASFLQGVGGFGVPVAVTAPILAGLGFPPLTAVLVPSIGHAWAVTFGSLASSFVAMVAATGEPASSLAPASALALGIVGVGCGIGAAQAAAGWRESARNGLAIALMGAAMAASLFALASLGLWPIASVGAGLAGMAVGLIVAGRRMPEAGILKRLGFGLLGYLVLVGLVSLVQFVPVLRNELNLWRVGVPLPSTVTSLGHSMPALTYRYAPLGHTGMLLAYAALLAYGLYRWMGSALGDGSPRRIASDTVRTMLPVTLGILAMVALAAVMEQAGMIQALAEALAGAAGNGFALVSPWIGALGAFVTGSNTSSNLMFGALQADTAGLLGLNVPLVLALQNVGGALGSVVSPTKIIVAVSTLGLGGQEGRVMRPLARTLAVLLLATSLAVALGMLLGVLQSP